MKNILAPFISFLILLISSVSCVTTQVTLFRPASSSPPPLSNSDEVQIYRTTHPSGPYTEIGLVTFKTGSYNLNSIYSEFRKTAAEHGADAVLDVRIQGESHQESHFEQRCVPQTNCSPDGSCTTTQSCHDEMVSEQVTTFTAVGSMVRRKL